MNAINHSLNASYLVMKRDVSKCENQGIINAARKFIILLCAMLLLTCSGVHAEEKNNYEEEIKMFENFYQHPENYSFQKEDGIEINQYILSKYNDFEKNQKV